jgi:hypothetical protein
MKAQTTAALDEANRHTTLLVQRLHAYMKERSKELMESGMNKDTAELEAFWYIQESTKDEIANLRDEYFLSKERVKQLERKTLQDRA